MKLENQPKLRLVGVLHLSGTDWDLDSFGVLFTRLPREVKHTGSLTRYVGYSGESGGAAQVRFFGVEVEEIGNLPDGMIAWELYGDTWTVYKTEDGQDVPCWKGDLTWLWSDEPPSGRVTGEFSAKCSSEWSSLQVCEFRMTSNAYTAPGKEGFDDDIRLVDYDPSWPKQYEEMAEWFKDELGTDLVQRIEHYGSTAVPGMPAKPVIDILVEVPSFSQARERIIPRLNNPEWEYWWYSGHMVFIKRAELMGQRTHHIHIAPAGHKIWKGIALRDYLRSYEWEASRYADLKRELAVRYKTDRERYTIAKSEFIEELTARALQAG